MKKPNKELKEWIKLHLGNILFIANLDDWNLSFRSSAEVKRTDPDFGYMSDEKRCATACIKADHEYLEATVVYQEDRFKEMWKKKNYARMINVLCHEVAHIITTEPFDELKIKYAGRALSLQERLTERVGRLIHRLYVKWMRDSNIDQSTGHEFKKKK